MIFRCDATARTGLGHLSRSIALAEACREAGETCRFVGRYETAGSAILAAAGFPAHVLDEGADDLEVLARNAAGRVVVLDDYGFDAELVARAAALFPVVVLDDFARLTRYPASSTILNFTVEAEALAYPGGPRLLLGPRYFLARRALRELRTRISSAPERAHRILVSIGGVDRHGACSIATSALLSIAPEAHVVVAAGTSSPALEETARLLASRGRGEVVVAVPSLAPLFATADAVVSGGGLTKYEAAYLGLPTAVLSQTADQESETRAFVRRGLALDLGSAETVTAAALASRLEPLLTDARARASLSERCLAAFPVDPTLDAARALLRKD